MKFVILLLFLAIVRASSQLDKEEQNIQKELNPLNEAGLIGEKRQQKRTIFGPGPYIYGRTRHVGIHPLGFKYVLGYGPIRYNYVLKPGVIKPVIKKPVLRPVKPAVTYLKPVLQTEGWKPISIKPVFKPVVAVKPVHSHVHAHSHVLSNGHVHTHAHGHVHTPVVQKPVVVAEKPVIVAQKPVIQQLVPFQPAVSILQFPTPIFKPIPPAIAPQPVLPITPLQPISPPVIPAPAVLPAPGLFPAPAVLPAPGIFPAPAVLPQPAPIIPELNPFLRPLNPLPHLHLLNAKLPLPPAVPIPNNGLAVPLPIHFQQTTQLKPVLPAALPPIHSHLDLLPNHLHIDQGVHAHTGFDVHDQYGHHLHLDQGHLHIDQDQLRLDPGHLHADWHLHTNQHIHPEAPNVIHTEQHLHQDVHPIHPETQLPLYLPHHPNFKPGISLQPIVPGNSIQTEFSATFPKYPLVQT